MAYHILPQRLSFYPTVCHSYFGDFSWVKYQLSDVQSKKFFFGSQDATGEEVGACIHIDLFIFDQYINSVLNFIDKNKI